MSKEDVEKAVKEAEKFAAEDKKKREDVETRNTAEQTIYQCENSMNEMGDKLSAEEKAPIEEQITKLRETLKGKDTEEIKKDTEELNQRFYKIAEKIYQAAQQNQPNAGQPADGQTAAPNGNVEVNGSDYEVKDDNNGDNK